jgi:hypothetical protein
MPDIRPLVAKHAVAAAEALHKVERWALATKESTVLSYATQALVELRLLGHLIDNYGEYLPTGPPSPEPPLLPMVMGRDRNLPKVQRRTPVEIDVPLPFED